MIVVPTPRWIWAALAVMVLCVIGYIIVGISASQRLAATALGTMPSVVWNCGDSAGLHPVSETRQFLRQCVRGSLDEPREENNPSHPMRAKSFVFPMGTPIIAAPEDGTIRHFWGGEMNGALADPGQDPRGAPDLMPIWTILDAAPRAVARIGIRS
jgi:hypothetical protein